MLKRASKSRPSGQWSAYHYDVFADERHVGRIMWTHAAPEHRRHLLELVAIYQHDAD